MVKTSARMLNTSLKSTSTTTLNTNEQLNSVVLSNIKLVSFTVGKLWKSPKFRRFFTKHVGTYDDAYSMATLVLYRAAELHNSSKGSFSNYAVKSMIRSLWKACHREGVIRCPGYSTGSQISEETRSLVSKSREVINSNKISVHSDSEYSIQRDIETVSLLEKMKELSYDERKALQMKFGVGCAGKSKSQKTIARSIKCAENKIPAIIESSICKLRRMLDA